MTARTTPTSKGKTRSKPMKSGQRSGLQASNARALARRLALQALYQLQMNPMEWQDVATQFAADDDMPKADVEYFNLLLRGVVEHRQELDEALAPLLDRKPVLLDPIEHAALWVASFEMLHQPQLPFRVIISEAVALTKRFGATDGHKFVNGVLDRAAREWRGAEHRSKTNE